MNLDKEIQACIDEFGKSLELMGRLEIEDGVPAIGITADIMHVEGELYREYSTRLIKSYSGEDPYVYMDRDYSEIIVE